MNLRHQIAVRIAPWLDVPYPEAREDAFRDLALVAYGSRDAVWTSPTVLVKTALAKSACHPSRILLPDRLSDEDYKRMRREWNEAHARRFTPRHRGLWHRFLIWCSRG